MGKAFWWWWWWGGEYLLLISQTGQSTAGLPVRNDAPRVLVRREEAHDPARDHVTDVGENAPRLVHLATETHLQYAGVNNAAIFDDITANDLIK